MITIRVVTCIEYRDGRTIYRTYASTRLGAAALKRRIRARLLADPTIKHVRCGVALYEHSYGAH